MSSKLETLDQSYKLMAAASVTSFLAQVKGNRAVRVATVDDGGSSPASDTQDYFLITNKVGQAPGLTRVGLEGQDVYMRSHSNREDASVVINPAAP